jgi:hypothetical protein
MCFFCIATRQTAAVPQVFKRDDQVWVREPEGKEYQAKLMKTDEGKIIAEYTSVTSPVFFIFLFSFFIHSFWANCNIFCNTPLWIITRWLSG